eukprot:CAMPEP_0204352396 /NCGR_PEP_ID=MMETSP0469-20131031/31857_1 /ASSEMBLY_ACC=CAM_ASM_000384 /TAXON_ID=2969 /ORGANISM="Oxyrrhis marina" /LENGTH=54 /DNA_ID=CAMNT_0051339121 /DNA_START=265 /DNA_END=429 /DNA_ORIENTATION=+
MAPAVLALSLGQERSALLVRNGKRTATSWCDQLFDDGAVRGIRLGLLGDHDGCQ